MTTHTMPRATTITSVDAWPAFDSRGTPTVAVAVELSDGTRATAITPSGASTGGAEARELRDGGERFRGKGVDGACRMVVERVAPALVGVDAAMVGAVDACLATIDPSLGFAEIGGNSATATSLAALRAVAVSRGIELFELVAGMWSTTPSIPLPMVNIVSGGAHIGVQSKAARGVGIQDVLAVPVGAANFGEAIEMTWRVREAAAALAAGRGLANGLVADEGGVALSDGDDRLAIALCCEAIDAAGLRLGDEVAVAIDVAANQLWEGDRYISGGRSHSPEEWIGVLAGWASEFGLVSIEDPLHDEHWDGWRLAGEALTGLQCLADDFASTQPGRIDDVLDAGANAVLVKVNQAGTVSAAAEVVRRAIGRGAATVVSARSGDTEEGWLADLAIGWGAGQIKVGSTVRSERTAKWNRVLEIAHRFPELGFAGRAALATQPASPSRGGRS